MNEIEWNTVKYIDCMDPDQGLPSLPDKSIDLCITDIPFNININSNGKTSDGYTTISKKKVLYNDCIPNWREFLTTLLRELERIGNSTVIYCGNMNLGLLCSIKEPYGFAYRYSKNSCSGDRVGYRGRIFPILFYGKPLNRLRSNCLEYPSKSGWLRKGSYLHPVPLNDDFWYDLISQLNPTSVIDPFLGSGTTAEVCTKLGIPWIGYEINEVYRQDIEKRLKNCPIDPKQITLERWKNDR